MHLGLFLINGDICATDPDTAARIAVAAEAAGWESVWTGEHYALPDPPVPSSPARADLPLLDPFVALAHLAGLTDTLRLGTGVTVVPLHHPLVLAKLAASLDLVSGGRFLLGVGVGYLEPELRALGVPLAERGARTDETIAAMRRVWAGDAGGFQGRHVSFSGLRAEPRPRTPLGPPIHVGGYAAGSFRRAVTAGHGWYGYALDLAQTEEHVSALRAAAARHDRPPELGPLEVSVTPPPSVALDDATLEAYAELGVTRLIALSPREGRTDADAQVRFVEELGARALGQGLLTPA